VNSKQGFTFFAINEKEQLNAMQTFYFFGKMTLKP